MPLARAQRERLALALRWARGHGWQHDAYPNTWRSADGQTHVRYDSQDGELVVDRLTLSADPLRCRVALVPVDSPDLALDVLAALGHLPKELAPGFTSYAPPPGYRGQHEAVTDARCLLWYGHEQHAEHLWQRGISNDVARCGGWSNDLSLHAGLGIECGHCGGRCRVDDDDDNAELDSPAGFTDAGHALADLVDGAVTADRAAEVLSSLAGSGLIVSVAYHEQALSGPADVMDDVAEIFAEGDK